MKNLFHRKTAACSFINQWISPSENLERIFFFLMKIHPIKCSHIGNDFFHSKKHQSRWFFLNYVCNIALECLFHQHQHHLREIFFFFSWYFLYNPMKMQFHEIKRGKIISLLDFISTNISPLNVEWDEKGYSLFFLSHQPQRAWGTSIYSSWNSKHLISSANSCSGDS